MPSNFGGYKSPLLEYIQKNQNTATNSGLKLNPFQNRDGTPKYSNAVTTQILTNPNLSDKVRKYLQEASGIETKSDTESKSGSAGSFSSNISGTGGNNIANAAQKYIGTPYVWGGDSMEEGGMDCSGFVYNALKDAGYNIGRTTAQGYRGYGQSVPITSMQAGDLLFFGNADNATHVGIYIGNGQMIHSSGGSSNTKSNPGKGVSVINVNHRNDLVDVRRY